jgi:hypothetical protein
MQTFLPYANFRKSVSVLDRQRLGKQRVEAQQILNALQGKSKGWVNHPATRMWRGYEPALMQYMECTIDEWTARGYNNNMTVTVPSSVVLPPWIGDERVHASHRSNLIRKDPVHYGSFGWSEGPDIPYHWPTGEAK